MNRRLSRLLPCTSVPPCSLLGLLISCLCPATSSPALASSPVRPGSISVLKRFATASCRQVTLPYWTPAGDCRRFASGSRPDLVDCRFRRCSLRRGRWLHRLALLQLFLLLRPPGLALLRSATGQLLSDLPEASPLVAGAGRSFCNSCLVTSACPGRAAIIPCCTCHLTSSAATLPHYLASHRHGGVFLSCLRRFRHGRCC